ncbi:SDR family NAD(P)-dependent oxidoreductase [bacterium]|jgi:UDP-N-acetylglucosamine/UDP-N-acetylgalactosamine 4-epimerase|nr:SDR family NAD(P)-dependent oxidoreductase [bacterium]
MLNKKMLNKKNTFLITGGAGFIGSNLAAYLLQNNQKVIVLDNLENGLNSNIKFLENLYGEFNFIKGDIRDFNTCLIATKNVDYVLHQAALGSVPRSMKNIHLYHENNISGSLNILESSLKNNIKKVVCASSSSVYGNTPILPKVETMSTTPLSPYALGKLTVEYYSTLYSNTFNLPTLNLRYFNVYGPRQNPLSAYAAVIPKFIKSFKANQNIEIYGNGEQTRDFTYIENVIDANIKAAFSDNKSNGEAINIGCGYKITINQLAKTIKNILTSTGEIIYKQNRLGDVSDSLADINKAKKLIDYKGNITLDIGLDKTINWYKGN